MDSPVSSEEFWDLLTENITLEELQAKRKELARQKEFNNSVDAASMIFTKKLTGISTSNLLKMRWSCSYRMLHELFPNSTLDLEVLRVAYQRTLRAILSTRPNIPHGRDAREVRRKLAQMHHGCKKK